MELYKKYRPQNLNEVIGNEEVISSIKEYLDKNTLPHTILITGESGIGKTTIARIIARNLGLTDTEIDNSEYNMSAKETRGIEGIAGITENIGFATFSGHPKIFIFDEADQITSDAQKMLKKILEDTPSHVYFILCTTRPEKLVKDIKTRATEFTLHPIDKRQISRYLRTVAENESVSVTTSVLSKIAEKSNGSMRKAMVILDQIVDAKEEEREKIIDGLVVNSEEQTINLAKMLLNCSPWSEVKEVLKTIKEDPETVRYGILGYCSSVLLGNNPHSYAPASLIISTFGDNYSNVGKAGLIRDCFDVIDGLCGN